MRQILIGLLLCCTSVHAQIPNADFENWGTASSGRPYVLSWPQMESAWHYRDTVAQQGNFALSVSIWYYYAKTVATLEAPVISRPAMLHGYYRYRLNQVRHNGSEDVEDTAAVQVWLCKWNGGTGQRDTVGHGLQYLHGSAGYSSFDCLINYTSTSTPDTFILSFDPSILIERGGYFCPFSDGYGSYLSIDNLSFQDAPASATGLQAHRINVFPNPADDNINIEFPAPVSGTMYITDIAGKNLYHSLFNGSQTRVNLEGLLRGIYFLQFRDDASNLLTARAFLKR